MANIVGCPPRWSPGFLCSSRCKRITSKTWASQIVLCRGDFAGRVPCQIWNWSRRRIFLKIATRHDKRTSGPSRTSLRPYPTPAWVISAAVLFLGLELGGKNRRFSADFGAFGAVIRELPYRVRGGKFSNPRIRGGYSPPTPPIGGEEITLL